MIRFRVVLSFLTQKQSKENSKYKTAFTDSSRSQAESSSHVLVFTVLGDSNEAHVAIVASFSLQNVALALAQTLRSSWILLPKFPPHRSDFDRTRFFVNPGPKCVWPNVSAHFYGGSAVELKLAGFWSCVGRGGYRFWLGHVAWWTMDSSVSPARFDVGFIEPVGRSPLGLSPCIASWPFSHVSSATS